MPDIGWTIDANQPGPPATVQIDFRSQRLSDATEMQ
jgi:hypothetical protein